MIFQQSSFLCKVNAVLAFMLLVFASTTAAQSLKVDVGMDTGRNDTAAKDWTEWQVPDGMEAVATFGDIKVTLSAIRSVGELHGTWFKKGLASGARMATDGVRSSGLELHFVGLEPGQHSLATWHNATDKNPLSGYEIVMSEGHSVSGTPSHRVESDFLAGRNYFYFHADENGEARIQILPTGKPSKSDVILNGFELDGSNPDYRAFEPFPEAGDLHVDGDMGVVILKWSAAPTALKYNVYFVRAASESEAKHQVQIAGADSFAHVASVKETSQAVKVDAQNSEVFYAWRVDTVDDSGLLTRGDIWTFRVRQLAFPGAEGYGRFAIGGRGGRVIKVTHLGDSGPGSLRAAIEASGPRTVVFDVSGRIVLESRLVVRNPFLTIAGHTAPGKGICISNYNLGMMGTHDVIIRHLRVRPGDTAGKTLDGMGMASSDHCIIDHCSISWTQDEAFSSRSAGNITLQRTLISEALNIAGHKKYKKGTQHGYAASISGDIGSFHYNLLAHCAGRNWSLAGGLDKAGVHCGRLDIRNNVVYNWSHRTTDGGAMEVNFINNYYKPGPATRVFHVLKPERNPGFGPQSYYVSGNVMEGYYGDDDPLAGVVRTSDEPLENYVMPEPFFESFVTTIRAHEAYRSVLLDVGANLPVQDEQDKRVIRETMNGTAQYVGSVSGLPGLPDSQDDVGGWELYPEVRRSDEWDLDGDGIPGIWERAFGLNPSDPNDARLDSGVDGYSHLEKYLHWLAAGNRPDSLMQSR